MSTNSQGVTEIQTAVYELAAGKPLSPESMAAIAALPDQ